jgi:hypothetical protein
MLSASISVDGNTMVSRFVAVVEDDAGWGCVKVESPEEMMDRDAKERDERIRSEAGLDVL